MTYCDFAEFYDILTEDVDYNLQAKYLTILLAENGMDSGILLDLACGTARLSIPLSDAGFDVIAVDESQEMLSRARDNIEQSGAKNIMLLNQSMQELDLYGTIDAAVCMLDSLNHLENIEQVKQVISRVSLFMNINGIFIFDINTKYKHKEILGDNTFVIEDENLYCVWQNDFYEEDYSVDISLDFFLKTDGKYIRTSQQISERAYDISEISSILLQTGFEVLKIYDDMSKNSIKEKTQRAVFVARKVK